MKMGMGPNGAPTPKVNAAVGKVKDVEPTKLFVPLKKYMLLLLVFVMAMSRMVKVPSPCRSKRPLIASSGAARSSEAPFATMMPRSPVMLLFGFW